MVAKKVNVIIVTHNSKKFIKRCLKSVMGQDFPKQDYSVTIVDNNSSDSTCDIVRSFPDVRIIKKRHNEGFSKANNAALKRNGHEYSILLNHDSWIEKDFIRQMAGIMDGDMAIGVCGGAEHPYDGKLKSMRKTEEVNWIGCGATMFRMKALKQAGFFDENYFMYNEDIDICLRLRFRNWKVYYNPKAIWHHYGWGRKLDAGDARIINSSLSRIYLLVKFASIGQIIASLRRYFSSGKGEVSERKTQPSNGQGKLQKSRFLMIAKILILCVPKVLAALAQRIKIRRNRYFSQKLADRLIQETDLQMY